MSANGAATLRLAAPTPAPTNDETSDLRAAIGEAMAAAATVLCQGVVELAGRGLRPETKMLGGERLARLYWLQQSAPAGFNFAAAVRTEGRRALREIHGEDLLVLDILIDGALEILAKGTAFERAMSH
jgi:hypothetical protein